MKIYNKDNIAALNWEQYKDGLYARNYLLPLITDSPQTYIQNAACTIEILAFQDKLFPLVLGNSKARKNSYVCSPFAQYIRYGKREMDIEFPGRPFFRITAKLFLSVVGLLCRAGNFDHVVYVNNWLLSTNLYHEFDLDQLGKIKALLAARYPRRAIVFRSVNERLNEPFLRKLKETGFLRLLSRQVYIIDFKKSDYLKKTDFKNDKKLFEQQVDFKWTAAGSVTEEALPVLKKLYDDLHLKKYSFINPQFTAAFIKNAIQTNILNVEVLRHENKIVAVNGFYIRDGVLTNPFSGYDTSYPAAAGLFRMVMLRSITEAARLQVIYNMSSGASRFKQTRGGEPVIEYNMVFIAHLKTINKLPWQFFNWLSHRVVIPMMKKHKL